MQTIADVGEDGLLAWLKGRFSHPAPGVMVGIGDDAAVLGAVKPAAIVSADLLVEGVDFDFAWASHRDVGHKAAAVNISDLAAMGAQPRGLLLSLALRPSDRVSAVRALISTFSKIGDRYGAPLIGGDLSRIDGPMVVSVTAIGQTPVGRYLPRDAGQPGDVILVTGTLGAAAAGLVLLMDGEASRPGLIRRQLRPTPRLEFAVSLAHAGLARSCADISDGLASDCFHVVSDGCGVELEPRSIPIARGVKDVCRPRGLSALELALTGGEDFELVIAARPSQVGRIVELGKSGGVKVTVVGSVVRGSGLHLGDQGRASVRAGFDHFSQ